MSGEARISPRDQVILEKIDRLVCRPAAEAYRDCCYLLAPRVQLHTASHLIGHLLRELFSMIEQIGIGTHVQQQGESDKCGVCGKTPSDTHANQVRGLLSALGIDPYGEMAEIYLSRKFHSKAHRNDISAWRPLDGDFSAYIDDTRALLEEILNALEIHYVQALARIDKIAGSESPMEDDADTLVRRLPQTRAVHEYLFNALVSPKWLQLRAFRRFFDFPPPQLQVDGTQDPMWRRWPAAEFLRRKASEEPQAAKEILEAVKFTENPFVLEALTHAANEIPAELATGFTSRLCDWITPTKNAYQVLPVPAISLVAHLAERGHSQLAARLLSLLLRVEQDSDRWRGVDFMVKADPYGFAQALATSAPILARVGGWDVLEMVVSALEEALRIRFDTPEEEAQCHVMNRPAIEEHDQNLEDMNRSMHTLIGLCRDLCVCMASENSDTAVQVVEYLRGRDWVLMHRMSLHVLRSCPDRMDALVAEVLTTPLTPDRDWCWHEFWLLAREQFSKLTPFQKDCMLRQIDKTCASRCPGDDEASRRARQYLKGCMLANIRESLPPEREAELAEVLEEIGEKVLAHPDFLHWTESGLAGQRSPKESGDLCAMGIAEMVKYLCEWKPDTGDPLDDSREGLARALSQAVNEEPGRFLGCWTELKALPLIYLAAFISGLEDSAKGTRAMNWANVVEVCGWMLSRGVEAEDRAPNKWVEEDEPEEQLASLRYRIVRLMAEGLKFRQSGEMVEFSLRERVWRIIERVLEDAEPPAVIARLQAEAEDPDAGIGISMSNRNGALDAAVVYALWVRRAIERSTDATARIARGFEEMPEVRSVLDRHLDPHVSQTIEVRQIYGERWPCIAMLDQGWACSAQERVFTHEAGVGGRRGRAAWNTYVTFNRIYKPVFEMLREEYKWRISQLTPSTERSEHAPDATRAMAEHLIVAYVFGWMNADLAQADNLLNRFFGRAGSAARQEAIAFAGRFIDRKPDAEPIEPMYVERICALIDWRLAMLESGAIEASELSRVIWAVRAPDANPDWGLRTMERSIAAGERLQPVSIIVEWMKSLESNHVARTIGVLDMLVHQFIDVEPWDLQGPIGNCVREVIRVALDSGDAAAQDRASALVNFVASKGFLAYRDLLYR